MEYEFNMKNKRLRVWLWLMVPSFVLTFILFIVLPEELPGIVPTLPLIIGFLIYTGWILAAKKKTKKS